MASAGNDSATTDTTRDFLRSFSVISVESESESDFDELSPIPEASENSEGGDVGDGLPVKEDDRTPAKIIPYSSILRVPIPFSESQRENCWIPGLPVSVEITSFERHPALKMLNPNLYTIKVTHGDCEWTIYRRFKHFKQLHEALALFRAKYKLPLPSKDHYQRRQTIMRDLRGMKQHLKEKKQANGGLPKQPRFGRFPRRPEALVNEEDVPQRMCNLQEYLQSVLTCKSYKNHPETLKFLEVSNMSFVNKLGSKCKEGLVEKCSGGRRINIQCCGWVKKMNLEWHWRKRWLVVKDNCVLYIRPEDGHVRDALLMDSAFRVRHGLRETGAKHGVQIENHSRKLLVKCWTSRKAKEWAEELVHVSRTLAKEYTTPARFRSFAPERENTYARWFVDGNTYFEAVADALEKAKEEIYITDWWLSPEIYLKRPIVDGDKWRLDVILKRKAEQGVKVFVLLYKEIEAALTIKSIYSKQTLMSHCPENIKVLRHPDHIPGKGVLLWAHHEKLVIIDQQIAFAGGLDLCYGRWDDENHRMTDLGSISLKPAPGSPDFSEQYRRQEYSSHTEVSMMTSEENLSVSHASPSGIGSSQAASQDHEPVTDANNCNNNGKSNEKRAIKRQEAEDREVEEKSSVSLEGDRELKRDDSSHAGKNSAIQPLEVDVIIAAHAQKFSTNESSCDESLQDLEKREAKCSIPEDVASCTAATLARQRSSPTSSLNSGSPAQHRRGIGSRTGGRALVRQPSSIIDTSGFSEDDLEVINKSMHPFKDVHNESYFSTKNRDHEELGDELNQKISQENVQIYLDDAIDKEIICMSELDSIGFVETSHRSHSPSKGRKHEKKTEGRKAVTASRLWMRRSKQKSLELNVPMKVGNIEDNATATEEGHKDNSVERTESGGERMLSSSKNVSKSPFVNGGNKSPTSQDEKDMKGKGNRTNLKVPDEGNSELDVKLRASSDSSNNSKGSDSSLILNPVGRNKRSASTPAVGGKLRYVSNNHSAVPDVVAHETKAQNQQPPLSTSTPASSRAFSLAATVGAMNSLRKMVGRRDLSQEDDRISQTSDGVADVGGAGGNNTARKRWRMVFNVSKFENIVKAPQVPERVDESLFYTSNIKHQGHRAKWASKFKDGMEKFTKQNRRDSGTLLDKKGQIVSTALHHTHSEEDILARGLLGSTKLWIGKDYVNFIYKDFVSLEQPFEDFIDRSKFPRMPWHDIGCVVYGKAARDLARHFIGRWNFTKQEKCKSNNDYPILVPKTTAKCSIPGVMKDITFEVKAQVLRSSCGWSAGLGEVENSIHEAYIHCIENSRNFIYIENQFFITQVDNKSSVFNSVGDALYKRILRAHRSKSNFKVYVVMPLLPAFEGEFGTNQGAALQAVTHWNYSSICRGGSSLMERLAKEVPDPNNYIVFCGLRTWDKLDNTLMTELVYVHSKLMIVDDDTVIIGSANINDRSLLGPRDSEIAIIFEDIHKVDVKVGDKQYQAGRFASSMRWTIFREHLGILNDPDYVDLTDIHLDSFYKDVWIKQAAINTTCFDKVFKCLPTDHVTNFNQLKQYQSTPPLANTDQDAAMKWLKKVKGYLVLTPLQFLKEENLTPKVGQKEALLPTYLWT